MSAPYYVGQAIKLANYTGTIASPTGGFVNSSGALNDPSGIQLAIKDPNGVTTTIAVGSLTKDAVGLYEYIYTIPTTGPVGTWYYAYEASGGYYGWSSFTVEPAPV